MIDLLACQLGFHSRDVGLGAMVIPGDGGAEASSIGVDQHSRLGHAGDADPEDLSRWRAFEHPRENVADRPDEVIWSGLRAGSPPLPDGRHGALPQLAAVEVDQAGLDPGRADVDADQQWLARGHRMVPALYQGRARPLTARTDCSSRSRPVVARKSLRAAPWSATASFQYTRPAMNPHAPPGSHESKGPPRPRSPLPPPAPRPPSVPR